MLSCSTELTEPNSHTFIEGIPDYYFENGYLDQKINEVKNAMTSPNNISFGFLTDIHISKYLPKEDYYGSTSGNSGYSPYLLKYVLDSLCIPFVLFGGDVPVSVANNWEEIIGSGTRWHEMMNVIGKEKVFQVRGNHDYLGFASIHADKVTYSTPKEVYPLVMGYNHVFDVKAPVGKMYYYFDVDNTDLRIIVLDDYGDKDTEQAIYGIACIGQEQYNWLINVALDCSNKSIVLLSHQPADYHFDGGVPYGDEGSASDVDKNRQVLFEIMKAFANKENLQYTSTDKNGTVTVSKDFTNNTNTFVCHLSGHRHKDDSIVTDGVLSITHTCDCYSGNRLESKWSLDGRTPDTITEHAVSIFSIDIDNRIIKMTRIGAGESRTWNY